MPLEPIRSLHYFLPVIEELLAQAVPEFYLAYLRSKVTVHPATGKTATTTGCHPAPPPENRPLFKFLCF